MKSRMYLDYQIGDVVNDALNTRTVGFIKRLDRKHGEWYYVVEWFDGFVDTSAKWCDIELVSRVGHEHI